MYCVYVFIAFPLAYKTNDVENDESFEIFYLKHQEQVIILLLLCVVNHLIILNKYLCL